MSNDFLSVVISRSKKKCSMGIIISPNTKGVEFIGDGRVEFYCNRDVEHPAEGEHSFKCDDFEMTWSVSNDDVWLA